MTSRTVSISELEPLLERSYQRVTDLIKSATEAHFQHMLRERNDFWPWQRLFRKKPYTEEQVRKFCETNYEATQILWQRLGYFETLRYRVEALQRLCTEKFSSKVVTLDVDDINLVNRFTV